MSTSRTSRIPTSICSRASRTTGLSDSCLGRRLTDLDGAAEDSPSVVVAGMADETTARARPTDGPDSLQDSHRKLAGSSVFVSAAHSGLPPMRYRGTARLGLAAVTLADRTRLGTAILRRSVLSRPKITIKSAHSFPETYLRESVPRPSLAC